MRPSVGAQQNGKLGQNSKPNSMNYIHLDNLHWQLFKVFEAESLTQLTRYKDHDVESFKQILEAVKRLSLIHI